MDRATAILPQVDPEGEGGARGAAPRQAAGAGRRGRGDAPAWHKFFPAGNGVRLTATAAPSFLSE
ncbi:MAG TPA: hypothetical protein VM639_12400 [Dongiaceae bacterium]|nr:hypothetical protein [Dongiaceae bacterium]